MKNLIVKKAMKLGLLTTEMNILFEDENYMFILDKCEYFCTTDYKLEVEFKNLSSRESFLKQYLKEKSLAIC